MESALPHESVSAALPSGSESEVPPFARQTVELTQQAYIQLKWAASYWKAQYDRAAAREAALKQEVAAQHAQSRDLTQRLYGKKSEKGAGHKPGRAPSPRRRGQQQARQGHGRTARPQLLVVEEVHDVAAEQQQCPVCGNPYREFPGTEDSEIVEVHVPAHIRRIKRKRYHKGCHCPGVPGIITAAPAARLLPKTPLGVSVWTTVLLDKYLYARPTQRLCEELRPHGVPIAGGMKIGDLRGRVEEERGIFFVPRGTGESERATRVVRSPGLESNVVG